MVLISVTTFIGYTRGISFSQNLFLPNIFPETSYFLILFLNPLQGGPGYKCEWSQIGTIQAVIYVRVRSPTEGHGRCPIRPLESPANDTCHRCIFKGLAQYSAGAYQLGLVLGGAPTPNK